jgi:hypothetical protein
MALMADPIGDGDGGVGHLEPLAEGPSEALALGPGESSQGVVKLLDRFGMERHLAGVSRGRSGLSGGRRTESEGLTPAGLPRDALIVQAAAPPPGLLQ